MHSRGGGRRRILSRTSERISTLNEDDDANNPNIVEGTPHVATRLSATVQACNRDCVRTLRVKVVLQCTAILVLCNLLLRFGALTATITTTNNWLDTENIPGIASRSRNQQRMERRRQRQELLRQRRNINMEGATIKEEQSNWKAATPSSRTGEHPDLMDPHDSRPPHAIPLFSYSTTATTSLLYLSETALQRRHECIAAIRKRHGELLRPFLRTPVAQLRKRHQDDGHPQQQPDEDEEHHLQEQLAEESAESRLPRTHVKKVLLVDPAYHKNVGDHMITLGEIAFLQRMGYTANTASTTTRPRETNAAEKSLNAAAVYEECTYIQGGPFLPPCNDFLLQQQQLHENASDSSSFLQNNVALWHGGGNWGDLWPKVQSMRASSLEPLFAACYNPIVSMPQSLHFHDETIFQKENTNVMRRAVMKNSTQQPRRLILTWREQKSHDKARRLYPFATHLVVPDIAFQLGPYAPIIKRGNSVGEEENDQKQGQRPQQQQLDILLLLRGDHESLYLHQRNRQAVREMLDSITGRMRHDGLAHTTTTTKVAGNRITFAIVDWPDRLDRFESSSPFGKKDIFFTNTSIQLLSLGRVLVCDRLHAAILAYLMGIPFVFVDQITGKIHQTLHTAFTSAGNASINDTTASAAAAAGQHLPCMDATAAMWAQADNLTHALEKAIGFLDIGLS